MKKIILFLFVFMIVFGFIEKNNSYLIPNDSIRLRIIANSNTINDQKEKNIIKNEVEAKVYEILEGSNNINDARLKINNNINEIDKILKKHDISYNISFGNNYFPEKIYKDVRYNEGYYESLVITIDKGLGDNWWCVLFPPLCLLDEQDISEVQYKLYASKIINKFS